MSADGVYPSPSYDGRRDLHTLRVVLARGTASTSSATGGARPAAATTLSVAGSAVATTVVGGGLLLATLGNGDGDGLSITLDSLGDGDGVALSGSLGGGDRGAGGGGRGSLSVGGAKTVATGDGSARPDSGTGDNVVTSGRVVQVVNDSGVGVGVGTGEGDTGGKGEGTGTGNLELETGGVELDTTGRVAGVGSVGLVEGEELRAEQVLAGLQGGDLEPVATAGSDQTVNSPVAGGNSVLPELNPDGTSTVGGSRGSVDGNTTLVGRGDNVVRSVGRVVVPLEGDGVSGVDGVPLRGLGVVDVADHGGTGQVLNGVVVGGATVVSEGVGGTTLLLASTVEGT